MDAPAYRLELAYSCDECGAPTKRRACASCNEYARIIPGDPAGYDAIAYGDLAEHDDYSSEGAA